MRYVTSLVLLFIFTATTVKAQDCPNVETLPDHLKSFFSSKKHHTKVGDRVAAILTSTLSTDQQVACITGGSLTVAEQINAEGPYYSADEEIWIGNNWRANSRSEYDYDESDRLTNNLFLRWNAGSESYVEQTARSYTYDASTNTSEIITQTWNGVAFENQYRDVFVRDSFDNTTRIERYDWENGDWKTRFLSTSVVVNGLVTERTIQSTHAQGVLANAKFYTYEYDGEGRKIEELEQEWNENAQSWSPIFRYFTSYPGSNIATITQEYEGGDWVDYSEETVVHNNQGLEIERTVEPLKEGAFGIRLVFTYDNDGHLTELLSQGVDEVEGWINQSRTAYTLDSDGDPEILVVQFFNTDSMAWDNISRVTYDYQQNEKTTSVEEELMLGLASFDIYPYPAQGRVNVELQLTQASELNVEVFDVLGRRIASLKEGTVSAGMQQMSWLPQDQPAGLYFVRLTLDGAVDTKPIVLVR